MAGKIYEQVTWIPADNSPLPLDGRIVLIATPESRDGEKVWLGFWDIDDGWNWCHGGKVTTPVTHWADLPACPQLYEVAR